MKLLEVRNLKKYFPVKQGFLIERVVGFVKAVDDVSFSVDRGKTIGIVGGSGCGKTTIGKSIIRLHEVTDGEMLIDEEDTTFYFMKKRRAKQYLKEKYFDTEKFNNGDGVDFEPFEKKMYEIYNSVNKDSSKAIDILFDKSDHKKKLLRQKAQIVFQDPMSSLNPRMTVGQMLTEPLLFHKLAKDLDEAVEMVKELLVKVGLSNITWTDIRTSSAVVRGRE